MRSASRVLVVLFTLVSAGCARPAGAPELDPVSRITDGFDANVRRDIETLREKNPNKLVPPLHGALLKNEQDIQLFERLAFLARRENG